MSPSDTPDTDRLTREKAEGLKMLYDRELLGHCGHSSDLSQIGWKEFKEYAEAKEIGEPIWILSTLFSPDIPAVTRAMVNLSR
jgi:hypothetical protein